MSCEKQKENYKKYVSETDKKEGRILFGNYEEIKLCDKLYQNDYLYFFFKFYDFNGIQKVISTEEDTEYFKKLNLEIKSGNLYLNDTLICAVSDVGYYGIYINFNNPIIVKIVHNKKIIGNKNLSNNKKYSFDKIKIGDEVNFVNGIFYGMIGERNKKLEDIEIINLYINFEKNNNLKIIYSNLKNPISIKNGFINYEFSDGLNGYYSHPFSIYNRRRNGARIGDTYVGKYNSIKNNRKEIQKKFYFDKNNERFGEKEKHKFGHINVGYILIDNIGNYQFRLSSDDYSFFHFVMKYSNNVEDGYILERGQTKTYSFKEVGLYFFEYFFHENQGGYGYKLEWKKPGDNSFSIVPKKYIFNADDKIIGGVSLNSKKSSLRGKTWVIGDNLKYDENRDYRLVINAGDIHDMTSNFIFIKNQNGNTIDVQRHFSQNRNTDMQNNLYHFSSLNDFIFKNKNNKKLYVGANSPGGDNMMFVSRLYSYLKVINDRTILENLLPKYEDIKNSALAYYPFNKDTKNKDILHNHNAQEIRNISYKNESAVIDYAGFRVNANFIKNENEITIVGEFKLTTNNSNSKILFNIGERLAEIQFRNNTLQRAFGVSEWRWVNIKSFDLNKFYQYVMYYNKKTGIFKLYVDGNLIHNGKSTSNYNFGYNSNYFGIGARFDNSGGNGESFFYGEVKNVFVFNRELSKREIELLKMKENYLIIKTFKNPLSNHPNNLNELNNLFDRDLEVYGSGTIDKIYCERSSGNNPFGSSDHYCTLIEGYLYIDKEGDYTFGIDGDDAVDLFIDDNYVTGWYGGHGRKGSPVNAKTIHLTKGYHKIKYRHEEIGGGDNYYLYWKRNNKWEIIDNKFFFGNPK